jgi:predicted permease
MDENTAFSMNILLIAAGCILLICCANVGSLLLARISNRQREFATRLAIGAGRSRIVRQLLTESAVLSSVALLASFFVWRATLQFLPALESSFSQGGMNALRDLDLVFDSRIFAIALLIAILANLIFSLGPALLGGRLEINSTLRQAFLPGGAGPRLRRVLVVVQVMLSFILLIGAGLFIKILARFESANPGFNTNVLIVNPGAPNYGFNNERNAGYRERVLEQIRTLPGVIDACWALDAPPEMGNGGYQQMVRLEEAIASKGAYLWIGSNVISSRYFKTLQIPIIQGRDFTEFEERTATTGAVIVNETMARQFWPGVNPLGKRLQIGKSLNDMRKNSDQLYEVIGVVRDTGYSRVWNGPIPYAYFTPIQLGYIDGGSRSKLHVSVRGNPDSMIQHIRMAFESFGPEAKVRGVRPLSEEISLAISRERSTAFVLSCFGSLALLLASIGLYGVISYSAARRSREFGIRLALGAPQANIMKLILREGMATVLIGLLIGFPCAMALTRLIASRLHGVSPLDPISYAAISALWIVVAILAVLRPARKAIVNPIKALRVD